MARRSEDKYTYAVIMNELRLALDPEDLVASVLLHAALNRVPQEEIADVLGISASTYRQWEADSPVLVGPVRERVIALIDWFVLVAGTHTQVRAALKSRAGLGTPPREDDNGRPTSGENKNEHV